MSDLLFVKRRGNTDLQYCVPQGYEWAITDSHRRPRTSLAPKHPLCKTTPQITQEENAQKKLSLGPWQHVKLRPAATPCQRNPLPPVPHKLHTGAPFCSIGANAGPCNVKVERKTHAYTPSSSLAQSKPKELTLRQKAIIKARSAVVLPVVAFSKNGEWVPQSLGSKAHARLTPHCSGGWSKRSVSMLFGMLAATKTVHLPFEKDDDGMEMECFSLDRPLLHSSALLLNELQAAKEQSKNAHTSMQRASALLERYCHHQGPDRNDSYSIRGINADSEGAEAQSHAAVRRHANENRFSVRSCCSARKKKKTT